MSTVYEFLRSPGRILDVRSPGEYAHAHIPNAYNLPLFSNEERAAVGTLYKHSGKEEAFNLGLQFVGPKLYDLVKISKQHLQGEPAKIHCWRGGMRSASVQSLLKSAGIQTTTLLGGYKFFRRWVLTTLQADRRIIILGGMTGSGKTQILRSLQNEGAQILDLEYLARHRGSSYGKLGLPNQPSQEQFENEIAVALFHTDSQKPLWIEDESKMIGRCKIPDALFAQMRQAPLIKVERPYEERQLILNEEYGRYPLEVLTEATIRLKKRLGCERALKAIQAGSSGQLLQAIDILLEYYDKTYNFGLSKRGKNIYPLCENGLSTEEWAKAIIKHLSRVNL